MQKIENSNLICGLVATVLAGVFLLHGGVTIAQSDMPYAAEKSPDGINIAYLDMTKIGEGGGEEKVQRLCRSMAQELGKPRKKDSPVGQEGQVDSVVCLQKKPDGNYSYLQLSTVGGEEFHGELPATGIGKNYSGYHLVIPPKLIH